MMYAIKAIKNPCGGAEGQYYYHGESILWKAQVNAAYNINTAFMLLHAIIEDHKLFRKQFSSQECGCVFDVIEI